MKATFFKGVDVSTFLDHMPQLQRQAAPFGCLRLDARARVLECNAAGAQLLGAEADWLLHKWVFSKRVGLNLSPDLASVFRDSLVSGRYLNRLFQLELAHAPKQGQMLKVKLRAHLFSALVGDPSPSVWLVLQRLSVRAIDELPSPVPRVVAKHGVNF